MDKDNSKQNKKVTVFALFLSLISIGILVVGFLIVSSNKVIMLQSVSNLYNKLDGIFDENLLIDKIAKSNDIGIKSDINIKYDDLSYDLTLNYLENSNDNNSRLDLIIKYLDSELLNGNIVLSDSKLYTFIKGITDKYYYFNTDYNSYVRSLSSNNYNKLLEYLKDSVDSIISNNSIKKEKATVKYNYEYKKVYKLSYNIDTDLLKEMANEYVKLIKNDKDLFKDISNYLEISEKDLNKYFDDIISLLPEENEDIVKYSVYYYGFNKIFRYELYFYDYDITVGYQNNKDNDIINVFKPGEEDDILNIRIKKDLDNYNFDITYIQDRDSYNIIGTYSKNKIELVYEDYKLILSDTIEEKNNNFVVNNTIEFFADDNKIVSINANTTYYFDAKISFDSTDSMAFEDMTIEDLDNILENLKNHPIYELIKEIIPLDNYLSIIEN